MLINMNSNLRIIENRTKYVKCKFTNKFVIYYLSIKYTLKSCQPKSSSRISNSLEFIQQKDEIGQHISLYINILHELNL